MTKIKVLPQKLVNLIAAGEVVERPASVLKELVENSLDADATRIKISIEDAGTKLIEVADNGTGIDSQDVELVFSQHATSKIHSESDLENIQSMGFRGEALASISSVAESTLIHSRNEKHSGIEAIFKNNKITIKNINRENRGTTVSIVNLFANIPARKKFLKSHNTELKHITNTFLEIAIANPSIHFEFAIDGIQQYKLTNSDKLENRIFDLFGRKEVDNLISAKNASEEVKIYGLIGDAQSGRKRNQKQYVFVNKRPVKSPLIYQAIKQAYTGFIHPSLQPSYYLFVRVNPKEVDVNIHPRKLEVKFSDEQKVFRSVYSFVNKTLEQSSKHNAQEVSREIVSSKPYNLTKQTKSVSSKKPNKSSTNKAIDFTKELYSTNSAILNNLKSSEIVKDKTVTYRSSDYSKNILQIFSTYILFEQGDNIVLIDQHAAAEKIQFEKLLKTYSSAKTKPLLIPEIVELTSPSEKQEVMSNQNVLRKAGFIVEDFSKNSIQVTEIPELLNFHDISNAVFELMEKNLYSSDIKLEHIQPDNKNKADNMDEKTYLILATLACHGSVRAGQRLSIEELRNIIEELAKLDNPGNCPHGRPIMVKISRGQLETMFDRKIN